MKKTTIRAAIAALAITGAALVVVAAPASAANTCGSQGKINYTSDLAYLKATTSCKIESLQLQYQPPASGNYYITITAVDTTSGYIMSTWPATPQAWRAKGCSSTSFYNCNYGAWIMSSSYTVMP